MKIGETSYVKKYCMSIGREKKQAVSDSEEEEEGEGESDEESPSTITTFREAIDCGNNLLKFLTEKGEEVLSEDMFKIVQQLQVSQLEHSKQLVVYSCIHFLNNCTVAYHANFDEF